MINAAVAQVNQYLPLYHETLTRLESPKPDVIMSLLCIGLLLSNEDGKYALGCRYLHHLRQNVLLQVQNTPVRIENIWIPECLFLLDFAGMFYADRSAMELSDIFHGSLVTIARRLRLLEDLKPGPETDKIRPASQQWLDWYHKEKAQRIGYCAFITDTQHSLLFGHERSVITPSEMKVPPAGSQFLWTAQNLQEFSSLSLQVPKQASTLSEAHQKIHSPTSVNSFISTLDTVGLLILSCHISSINDYHRMKFATREGGQEFEAVAANALPAIGRRLNELWRDPLYVHARTLYHLTSISLSVPFRDLEDATNSGFSSAGQTPSGHARTAMIRLLANRKVNEDPARHAVELLQLLIGNAQRTLLPLATSALYLGTLTLWAFAVGRGAEGGQAVPRQSLNAANVLGTLFQKIDQPNARCLNEWADLCSIVSGMLATSKNSNAQEYSEVLQQLVRATI